MLAPCLVDSASKDSQLYCLHVQLDLQRTRPRETLYSPFSGGELVALSSSHWASCSETAVLGVVQSWDPIYDSKSRRRYGGPDTVCVRILICVSKTGGDGAGGRGGWLRTEDLHICNEARKKTAGGGGGEGIAISIASIGSVMTASREFQAILSVADFSPRLRRCLLDPSLASGSAPSNDDGDLSSPPGKVPPRLWRTLVETFNRSQVLAIRQVVRGSAAGLTLLQVG